MTENNTKTTADNGGTVRYVIIAGIIIAAFIGSYSLAVAGPGRGRTAQSAAAVLPATPVADDGASVGGGFTSACCGGSDSGVSTPTNGSAVVEGGIQRISVDLSTGSYDPNTLKLKAGVPAEITFGQSSGCTAQVQSKDLGFFEDLTSGPVTVKLPALKAGTYGVSCGMEMVFGTIVVE